MEWKVSGSTDSVSLGLEAGVRGAFLYPWFFSFFFFLHSLTNAGLRFPFCEKRLSAEDCARVPLLPYRFVSALFPLAL